MNSPLLCAVQQRNRKIKRAFSFFLITFLLICCIAITAKAAPGISIDLTTASDTDNTLGTIEILMLMVSISLIPSMLILMTCFTRVVIVLSFIRNALGTQQTPPNQVIIGLALFLSLFIMKPTVDAINNTAYKPYKDEEITSKEALDSAQIPLKEFMLRQVQKSDLNLFLEISKQQLPQNFDIANQENLMELGLEIIVPSFITSELKRAFTMGFLIFIPFLIIDIVVASTLMSMGMMMLPPAMISLPFKLLTFILVDGWTLLLEMLVKSFR